MTTITQPVAALTLDDLLQLPTREVMLIAGKDGSGKTSAVVSVAAWVALMTPKARMFVIDTENKFAPVVQSFGSDAPRNLFYYRAESMNAATEALDDVLQRVQPGDWLAVESMGRLWDRAQDMAYLTIAGLDKATYLERRRDAVGKKPPITPRPDDFWSVCKGAHDGAFVERLVQHTSLNVLLTTTISKPPRENSTYKESEARRDVRAEFGIDAGLEGAPRLPYYVQTLCLLERRRGIVCRVLRDNLSTLDDPVVEFAVESRKQFAQAFWSSCRV
jgi:hypothetical protein